MPNLGLKQDQFQSIVEDCRHESEHHRRLHARRGPGILGLPNIAPMQEAALKQMQATMDKAAQTLGPESVMKTLFPENLAEMQKSFLAAVHQGHDGLIILQRS